MNLICEAEGQGSFCHISKNAALVAMWPISETAIELCGTAYSLAVLVVARKSTANE